MEVEGFSSGNTWGDYDNDGDVDVIVANWGSRVNLYVNDGTGVFARSGGGDLTGRIHHAGTMASADYDLDGDVDVLIANWPNEPGPDERNRLYRNTGNDRHWLQVRLVGSNSNRSAIGARGRDDEDRRRNLASDAGDSFPLRVPRAKRHDRPLRTG